MSHRDILQGTRTEESDTVHYSECFAQTVISRSSYVVAVPLFVCVCGGGGGRERGEVRKIVTAIL